MPPPETRLVVAHSSQLDGATRAAARTLLDAAYDGDFGDDDWEHSLGGMHALAWAGGELIGHGAVVQRRLLHGGRALRAGYLEGVGVRADRRGEGHGAALMDALEAVVRAAYDFGALSGTEEALGFYPKRGWQLWRGRCLALTPTGLRHTPDDEGGIFVLPHPSTPLDLDGDLACDYRDGELW